VVPTGSPITKASQLRGKVDLHATIADLVDATVDHPTHGRSLVPLIEGTAPSVREHALFGYWGRHVGITDGRLRYLRGCGEANFPLSVWANRWSTVPVSILPELRLPRPDRRATLQEMPGTAVPVIRQPFEPGDRLPFWAGYEAPSESFLFDTGVDPGETENHMGTPAERDLLEALAGELRAISAPEDLLERIGVA